MSYKNTHIAKLSSFIPTFFEPLRRQGVPIEKLLRGHPLNKFDLNGPDNYVPMLALYDFMYKCDRYLGTPGVMSLLSSDNASEPLSDYAKNMFSNPNLLGLIEDSIKYEAVIATNLRAHFKITGSRSRFSFVFIDPPSPGWEFGVAVLLINTMEVFKLFGGPDWTPLELQVPGTSVRKIEKLLPKGDYPIKYGYPDYGIIFPTTMLYMSNPYFEIYAKSEKPKMADFSVANCTERLLKSYKPGLMGTMDDMADYFNLSTRTVRRMLKEEGKTFTELRERAIFLRSLDLLSSSEYKIHEIAEYLGYSESANFIRFFKTYSGISPGMLRNS